MSDFGEQGVGEDTMYQSYMYRLEEGMGYSSSDMISDAWSLITDCEQEGEYEFTRDM
jgi:hypothetical protein